MYRGLDLVFSLNFDALGVRFDFSVALAGGALLVSNKTGRREELVVEILAILGEGSFPPARAAQLRRERMWAGSYVHRRSGARALA